MALAKEAKEKIVTEYRTHEGDTGSPQVQVALLSKRINDLTDIYLPFAEGEFYPTVFFTPEELEELEFIQFDINEFTNLKRAQWLANGGIEEEWDAYLAQLDAMGLGRFIEIHQAALDRYLAAQEI